MAPLSVAGLMRSAVFGSRTVVLTSATLKLGGEFTPLAASVGLRAAERHDEPDWPAGAGRGSERRRPTRTRPVRGAGWTWGRRSTTASRGSSTSPARLPPPGRDGLSEAALAEIAELVWAAGGRTLGLFSSRRAAETAAVHVRRSSCRS